VDGGAPAGSASTGGSVDCVLVGALLGALVLLRGTGGEEAGALIDPFDGVTGAPALWRTGSGFVIGAGDGAVAGPVIGAKAAPRHAHPVPLMISRTPRHKDKTRTRPLGLGVLMPSQKKAAWAAGGIGLPAR
jgi:hypothetical protein